MTAEHIVAQYPGDFGWFRGKAGDTLTAALMPYVPFRPEVIWSPEDREYIPRIVRFTGAAIGNREMSANFQQRGRTHWSADLGWCSPVVEAGIVIQVRFEVLADCHFRLGMYGPVVR